MEADDRAIYYMVCYYETIFRPLKMPLLYKYNAVSYGA